MTCTSAESALTNQEAEPRTRKRFKTPSGPSFHQREPLCVKRTVEASASGQARGRPRARKDHPNPEYDPTPLLDEWQDLFRRAALSAPHHGNVLMDPEHDLVQGIRSRLQDWEVMQVFLGKDCKSLYLPVGALPSTAAPFRISLAQREGSRYQFGPEDRSCLSPDRSRRRIPVCQILITVLARRKDAGSLHPTATAPNGSVSAVSLPQTSDENPQIVNALPPLPTPIHGPAFRALTGGLQMFWQSAWMLLSLTIRWRLLRAITNATLALSPLSPDIRGPVVCMKPKSSMTLLAWMVSFSRVDQDSEPMLFALLMSKHVPHGKTGLLPSC